MYSLTSVRLSPRQVLVTAHTLTTSFTGMPRQNLSSRPDHMRQDCSVAQLCKNGAALGIAAPRIDQDHGAPDAPLSSSAAWLHAQAHKCSLTPLAWRAGRLAALPRRTERVAPRLPAPCCRPRAAPYAAAGVGRVAQNTMPTTITAMRPKIGAIWCAAAGHPVSSRYTALRWC